MLHDEGDLLSLSVLFSLGSVYSVLVVVLAANDPDMVRMALLKGLIVAETLVEDAGETLSPFADFMERNHDSTYFQQQVRQ